MVQENKKARIMVLYP